MAKAAVFGREEELGKLVNLAVAGVDRIVVVLGPQLSGKTSVLRRFNSLWQADKNLEAPVFLFEMGSRILGSKLSDVQQVLGELQQQQQHGEDEKDGVRPVLIVDDAHELSSYPQAEAKQVVECLKAMACERKATVIMSTFLDSFRESWIGDDVEVVSVGHFDEMRARAFVCKTLAARRGWWRWLFSGSVGNEEWKKIYSICGGCPFLLKDAAVSILKDPASLHGVLAGMVDATRMSIFIGLSDSDWAPAKFREVMELMVSREHGMLEWASACDKLFGGDQSQLKAMQARYVFHVQSAAAPEGGGFVKLIMPLSPPHLEAMKLYLAGEEEDD